MADGNLPVRGDHKPDPTPLDPTPLTAAPVDHSEPSIPSKSEPWYESNLFWGAVGAFISFALMVVPVIMKDLRWLLFGAFPFGYLALWAFSKSLPVAGMRRRVIVIGSLTLFGMLFGVYSLMPKPPITQITITHDNATLKNGEVLDASFIRSTLPDPTSVDLYPPRLTVTNTGAIAAIISAQLVIATDYNSQTDEYRVWPIDGWRVTSSPVNASDQVFIWKAPLPLNPGDKLDIPLRLSYRQSKSGGVIKLKLVVFYGEPKPFEATLSIRPIPKS